MKQAVRLASASLFLLLLAATAGAQDIERAKQIIREVAAACPRAYGNAHRGENTHPEAWDFVILATRELKKFDSNFGLNGKRGNPNDPSSDALAYGSGAGLHIVDFIIGAGEHGNDLGRITWQDVTDASTVGGVIMGVNVDPTSRAPVVACGDDVGPGPIDPPPGGLWDAFHSRVWSELSARRLLTAHTIAEQFAFSFPGQEWGNKSADSNRPVSGDVIARRVKGRLIGYRVLPTLSTTEINLGAQHFIAVAAVDHLGTGKPVDPIEPVDPVKPVDPPPNDALARLTSLVEQLTSKVDALLVNQSLANDVAGRQSELLNTIHGDTWEANAGVNEIEALLLKALPTTLEFPEYVGEMFILRTRVPISLKPASRPQP